MLQRFPVPFPCDAKAAPGERRRIPIEAIGVVQVHETHPRRERTVGGEALDRLRHQWMRNVRDGSAGYLVRGKEGPVQERDVDALDDFLDLPVPLLPLVDVGKPQQLSRWAADDEGHCIGVLVSMRYGERSGVKATGQIELDPRTDLSNLDVLSLDE